MEAPVVLAVDGNSLVHRSFHAQANSGQPAWAVRGLLSQLVAAVDRIRPTAVVVGFDDVERSARREQWPTYKANRTEKLPTLVEQLSLAVDALQELGVAVVIPDGLEADDVLASAAAFSRRLGGTTVVVTSDRDAFALIDEHTRVLRIINGGVDASPVMTPDRLFTLLGVHPAQYRDYAALRGDPSDNLPGVRGIGPRNASRLLAEFGSAAAAFDDLDAVRDRLGGGPAGCLSHPDARTSWELNCVVMAMHDDVALDLDLAGGRGVLPLQAGVVDTVFRAQNLTWSASRAVAVLADVEGFETRPPRPIHPPDIEPPPSATPSLTGVPPRTSRRPERRAARRAPRRPLATQLSLFE